MLGTKDNEIENNIYLPPTRKKHYLSTKTKFIPHFFSKEQNADTFLRITRIKKKHKVEYVNRDNTINMQIESEGKI